MKNASRTLIKEILTAKASVAELAEISHRLERWLSTCRSSAPAESKDAKLNCALYSAANRAGLDLALESNWNLLLTVADALRFEGLLNLEEKPNPSSRRCGRLSGRADYRMRNLRIPRGKTRRRSGQGLGLASSPGWPLRSGKTIHQA